MTNGEVTIARRLEAGKNQRWTIIVEPDSDADVTIELPATTDCEDTGAICIGARPLSAGDSVTVPGPLPGLSVADARVTESEDATVDFTVTLSRAAAEAVTVDYATSDSTATAGTDYTSTSGTLTFAAGETEKTVSVPVIDDSHDESDETFTVTLSNASGGDAYLEDATATGTIADDDEAEVLLTAEFRDLSVEAHDGSTAFTFELRFSENWTSGLSYTTLRDHAFTVTNGEVENARRLEAGKNQRWTVIVEPDSDADVTIELPATTDCADTGALCIGTRPLSAGVSVTVPGPPPGLSAADAQGTEAAGAAVNFTVTLSRAASAVVTVDYATSNGTATAGSGLHVHVRDVDVRRRRDREDRFRPGHR